MIKALKESMVNIFLSSGVEETFLILTQCHNLLRRDWIFKISACKERMTDQGVGCWRSHFTGAGCDVKAIHVVLPALKLEDDQ